MKLRLIPKKLRTMKLKSTDKLKMPPVWFKNTKLLNAVEMLRVIIQVKI